MGQDFLCKRKAIDVWHAMMIYWLGEVIPKKKRFHHHKYRMQKDELIGTIKKSCLKTQSKKTQNSYLIYL